MQVRSGSRHDGSAGAVPACASCKHQRKKCTKDCMLAPHFPADKSREFQAVHSVFGVSKATKLIRRVRREDRKHVTDSLIWSAYCWQNDPVSGCLGAYRKLEETHKELKMELEKLKGKFPDNSSISGHVWNPTPCWSAASAGVKPNPLMGYDRDFVGYSAPPFYQFVSNQKKAAECGNLAGLQRQQQPPSAIQFAPTPLIHPYNNRPHLSGQFF